MLQSRQHARPRGRVQPSADSTWSVEEPLQLRADLLLILAMPLLSSQDPPTAVGAEPGLGIDARASCLSNCSGLVSPLRQLPIRPEGHDEPLPREMGCGRPDLVLAPRGPTLQVGDSKVVDERPRLRGGEAHRLRHGSVADLSRPPRAGIDICATTICAARLVRPCCSPVAPLLLPCCAPLRIRTRDNNTQHAPLIINGSSTLQVESADG